MLGLLCFRLNIKTKPWFCQGYRIVLKYFKYNTLIFDSNTSNVYIILTCKERSLFRSKTVQDQKRNFNYFTAVFELRRTKESIEVIINLLVCEFMKLYLKELLKGKRLGAKLKEDERLLVTRTNFQFVSVFWLVRYLFNFVLTSFILLS